jgi:hypothetical protein
MEKEKFYPVDISGSINKYPAIFNINYDEKFKKNHEYCNASNKRKIRFIKVNNDETKKEIRFSRNNTEVYYLECLEILDINLWNDCYKLDVETGKITINYGNFSEICCDIQRCLKGTLNFSGNSFTNKSLIPGDFETYYFQYMAYKMFGNHLAFYGFQNLGEIKEKISLIPKQFISSLNNKIFLETLENNSKNSETNDGHVFKKGDVLEFSIVMKNPKIKLLSKDDTMTNKYNKIEKKYKIGDSIWNVYFIIL